MKYLIPLLFLIGCGGPKYKVGQCFTDGPVHVEILEVTNSDYILKLTSFFGESKKRYSQGKLDSEIEINNILVEDCKKGEK